MSDFWPDHLVQELVHRRGIIFLGSGAARTCCSDTGVRPPDWCGLLTELAKSLQDGVRAEFDKAIARERLLDAAQLVTDNVDFPTYQSVFHQLLNNHLIKPSALYEAVSLIDQQVVMTTNYDRLYERYWEQLLNETTADDKPPLIGISHYDDGLIDNLRSNRRLLLKLHGTVTDAAKLVLARSQYAKARFQYPFFFRAVSALLLTRTVLFVGCGFNGDPDIDLLLEDAAFAAQAKSPHYAILPAGKSESEVRSIKSSFNVRVLEYDIGAGGDHGALMTRLTELAELVESYRV